MAMTTKVKMVLEIELAGHCDVRGFGFGAFFRPRDRVSLLSVGEKVVEQVWLDVPTEKDSPEDEEG